ncbi:MAG: DNA polymerase subunit beta [Sphingobacteriaceae bacterium]|nr:MAG: DNA polymerase subunit beta [Sphingobacteriaceae bacterium]
MNLKEAIQSKLTEFLLLCKNHEVKTIYAFGSSVNNNFDEKHSDIDLLIEIDTDDPIERGENLMKIWDQFEIFFHRKVDLLTTSAIKNPVLIKNIDATKVLIYDGKEQKVSI